MLLSLSLSLSLFAYFLRSLPTTMHLTLRCVILFFFLHHFNSFRFLQGHQAGEPLLGPVHPPPQARRLRADAQDARADREAPHASNGDPLVPEPRAPARR